MMRPKEHISAENSQMSRNIYVSSTGFELEGDEGLLYTHTYYVFYYVIEMNLVSSSINQGIFFAVKDFLRKGEKSNKKTHKLCIIHA